jgi:serine protease SohB
MAEPSIFKNPIAALRRLLPARFRTDIPIVPLVRLSGVIGISSPLRPGLTLASVARSLERAFSMRNARAVALSINSPGGAAAQSHLIHRRIRALADEKKVPVIAFVEDVAASGGYMIACAADEIIADPSSIVGSIGVVGGSFGFDKLIEKIGIERRLYTSGENKAMLDPFLPEKPEDVERLKALQREIHESFIALVKDRRGAKLDSRETALFSGAYWTGQRGLELGLVDAVGDLRNVLRGRYGDKLRTPLIAERGFFGRRVPGVSHGSLDQLWNGSSLADDMVATLEARALWSRYGL